MPSRPTPSTRTLLTLYDLIFYFCLCGPKIQRNAVIAYLARITGGTAATRDSQARSFERTKRHLIRLGVRYESVVEPCGSGTEASFVIPQAWQAKAKVEQILEARRRAQKLAREAKKAG